MASTAAHTSANLCSWPKGAFPPQLDGKFSNNGGFYPR